MNGLPLDNPALFAVCLNALGKLLKMSPLDNKWIPLILTFIGLFAYPLVTSHDPRNYMLGFLFGAGSVGIHQIYKQRTNETST